MASTLVRCLSGGTVADLRTEAFILCLCDGRPYYEALQAVAAIRRMDVHELVALTGD